MRHPCLIMNAQDGQFSSPTATGGSVTQNGLTRCAFGIYDLKRFTERANFSAHIRIITITEIETLTAKGS